MMLRPTKHAHPDQTIIHAAFLLLTHLKKHRIGEFDALRHQVKEKIKGGEALFLPALNFLYLMGLIEYRSKTDAVEYVGN